MKESKSAIQRIRSIKAALLLIRLGGRTQFIKPAARKHCFSQGQPAVVQCHKGPQPPPPPPPGGYCFLANEPQRSSAIFIYSRGYPWQWSPVNPHFSSLLILPQKEQPTPKPSRFLSDPPQNPWVGTQTLQIPFPQVEEPSRVPTIHLTWLNRLLFLAD